MGDDPKMLLDHYQHIADKQKKAAVEALPEIIFTANNYGKKMHQKNNGNNILESM